MVCPCDMSIRTNLSCRYSSRFFQSNDHHFIIEREQRVEGFGDSQTAVSETRNWSVVFQGRDAPCHNLSFAKSVGIRPGTKEGKNISVRIPHNPRNRRNRRRNWASLSDPTNQFLCLDPILTFSHPLCTIGTASDASATC
jgi:hypothetical protein